MLTFVTGATGFIGPNLVRTLLRRGHQVRVLTRPTSDRANLKGLPLDFRLGDVRQPPEILAQHMQGCDVLFHTAAYYTLWAPRPQIVYDTNLQGTENIMEAALLAQIPRVVHTSSVATIGRPHRREELANETFQQRWKDLPGPYERSKYQAEQAVLTMVRERGLPAIVVNPTAPVGFYDSRPTPTGRMIADLLKGRIWGYVEGGINIVDVEDVALGHLLAAGRGRIGERYILGGQNLTFRELFRLVCHLGGRQPPEFKVPFLLALLAAYFDEGVLTRLRRRPPNIPIAGVKLARQRMFFDSSKASNELGLPDSPVEEALRKAILWSRYQRLLW